MNTAKVRRVWVRWLNKTMGLPLPHVAAVLGSDLETIKRDATVTRGRPSRACDRRERLCTRPAFQGCTEHHICGFE